MSTSDRAGEGVTVEDVQRAVHEHLAMKHPLFEQLKELADAKQLAGEKFRLVASNIIARTLFTLSEILAGCTQATLDLSYLRIADSIHTAADEGGHGKEANVHPKLMVDALNNHLVKAYGQREIDVQPVYFALQGKYLVARLQEYLRLEQHVDVPQRAALRSHVLFDEKFARLRFLAESITGARSAQAARPEEELAAYDTAFSALLKKEQVTDETVEYSHHQLHVLENPEPGYLSGVNFAHEEVADELFRGLYAITVPYAGDYPDNSFETVTYRWMREHGPYAAQHRGETGLAKGVEQMHAEREIRKLRTLNAVQLGAALRGAADFSERNVKVWNSIAREVLPAGA